ncbi:ABC transporter [Nitrospira sp.]|nr:ABC transporter [Nitrospira sp.]
MNSIAVRATQIAKKYVIRVGERRVDSLAEGVKHKCRRMFGSLGRASVHDLRREEIWPLKDASFEINRGEVVGVIGRNGAGKSTLLKILSRITEPTRGRAEIHGRVGTLLEVGTGFHPELTGRDNIYLSGIILGMRKAEIDRKFEEIVEFAGIGKFVDTPVKRYSSGMYVRLAFAVGAHLEPEVLIVDEVLAVGDMQFQKKCLDKMHEIGDQGRTVIFVSHNMQAITRLCRRVLLLDQGRLIADGGPGHVVGAYLHAGANASSVREWSDVETAPGDATARLRAIRIRTGGDSAGDIVDVRRDFLVEMEFDVLEPGLELIPNVVITNEEGIDLFETFDLDPSWRHRPRNRGRYRSSVRIPGNLLPEGTFFVSPACFSMTPHRVQFYEREVIAFQVVDEVQGDSARGHYSGEMLGVVRPKLQWYTHYVPEAPGYGRSTQAA